MSIQGRTVAALSVLSVMAASLCAATGDGPGRTAEDPAPVAGWWRTDLGAVPLGTAEDDNRTATALARQWSHYGQGQEEDYGNPVVVAARAAGRPEPPGGGDPPNRRRHAPGAPPTERKGYK